MSASLIWFIVGIAMMLLEFVIPGLIVIFFGVGAWVTALLMLILPLPLEAQLVVFLIGSVASLAVLRRYLKRDRKGEDTVTDSLVGLTGEITKDITKKKAGAIFLNGTTWRAESDETLVKGEKALVTAEVGLVLRVKRV